MKQLRTLRCLSLIALVLLLAGAIAAPPAAFDTPAVLADDDDDDNENGNGDDGGDDGNGDDDDSDDDDDDDNNENREEKEKEKKGKRDNGTGSAGQVEQTAAYSVEVACAYDQAADETTCTVTGAVPAGGETASHVDLPASEICAEVVGGDHEYLDPDPDTRVVGYKSRGSDGTFTLILTGQVTPEGTATYWFSTDDGVFPATGPGLRCSEPTGKAAPQVQVTTTPNVESEPEPETAATAVAGVTVGDVLVQTYACPAFPSNADVDWYGICEPGVEDVSFTLHRKEESLITDAGEGATDTAGMLLFEALAPGAYNLDSTDFPWCHAESDNVDEHGDLIVEGAALVTVWIFLCAASPATPPGA